MLRTCSILPTEQAIMTLFSFKWRVIPTNCHGWSRNGYGAAEFISHESITCEVAIDILSLEASYDPLLFFFLFFIIEGSATAPYEI